MPTRCRGNRGFTLVELLVVIAIITILAALLLPVLGAAKRSAQGIACMSNLKQVAVWGFTYADDWNGVLPTSEWDNHPASYRFLSTTLWYEKVPFADLSWGEQKSCTALHCPTATSVVKPRNYFGREGASDYALNAYIGGSYGMGGFTFPVPKAHTRLRPQSWWFCDSAMTWHSYWSKYVDAQAMNIGTTNCGGPWMWGSGYDPSGVKKNTAFFGQGHPGNAANFCYGDGHVESMQEARMLGMTSQERTAWNYVP